MCAVVYTTVSQKTPKRNEEVGGAETKERKKEEKFKVAGAQMQNIIIKKGTKFRKGVP